MSEPAPRSEPPPPDASADHPALEAARRLVERDDGRTVDEQVELTRIPAPPFREEARAEHMAALLEASGIADVRRDDVGNVLARVPVTGRPDGPPLVLSAHLDTVFPEGTDVEVSRNEAEGRWEGPGIADDGRGLAALLAVARAVVEARVPLAGPLLLAATVGEEGLGDLRGVKHLFREGGGLRDARGFVSVDGTGLSRIVHRGVGSRRLRVTVRGRGGHSWSDWGIPNPIHALARAVAELAEMGVDEGEAATLTVARWGGGISVNTLPSEAWAELDVRSEGREVLEEVERGIRTRIEEAVDREREVSLERLERKGTRPGDGAGRANGAEGADGAELVEETPGRDAFAESKIDDVAPPLELEIEVIGDRPPGRTDSDHPLVRAAVRATEAVGREPDLTSSSTDANYPMALGIPALTVGGGGRSGRAHTEEEWYANDGGPEGIYRVLLIVAGYVGLSD